MTLEEFKELKPGDKVKIIDTPVSKTNDGTPEMDQWCGRIMTIESISNSQIRGLYVSLKEGMVNNNPFEYYCWYPWMIEKKVTEENSPEGIELLKRENADLKAEIVRLKARLFDYMDEK